jgi:hypothetical protein
VNRCLNCGGDLVDAFCAHCGQRAVPPDPTVREIASEVWQELSGYDGRIAATFRSLLHPGQLTVEYLQGRRARYFSPIKLYLSVSVLYFLVAAAAPVSVGNSTREVDGPGGMRISVTSSRGSILTDDDRANIEKDLETTQWWLRPMLKSLTRDPEGFRARLFEIMPRVFFAMLPVFAAVVAVFYRNRRFPVALVFSVHLHAFAFLILTIPEAAKMLKSTPVEAVAAAIAVIGFVVYALMSLRAVFGGGWPITIVKALSIGAVYLIASIPAFFVMLIWASLV